MSQQFSDILTLFSNKWQGSLSPAGKFQQHMVSDMLPRRVGGTVDLSPAMSNQKHL